MISMKVSDILQRAKFQNCPTIILLPIIAEGSIQLLQPDT